MKSLEIPNLSDEMYQRIEDRAQRAGRSIAEEAIDLLGRALKAEAAEDKLMAEVAAEREERAKRGVFATEEFIDAAIKWGRE